MNAERVGVELVDSELVESAPSWSMSGYPRSKVSRLSKSEIMGILFCCIMRHATNNKVTRILTM